MRCLYLLLFVFLSLAASSQEKEKKDDAEPKKSKSIGEKIGNLAGNMLTAKTDKLDNIAPTISIISGLYDMRTRLSESKYLPEGTHEGDYAVSVSFFKYQGSGLLNLKDGQVLCDGKPMEYVGLGSYLMIFPEPFTEPKKLVIRAPNGDSAVYILKPVPEIEIVSVNDDRILPFLDLSEDITVEYSNPPGSENTTVHAGLLTDIMGARAINNFADFPAKNTKVTIPKEALSNLTYSGKMGAGQLNKGSNYFVLERQLKTENSQLGPEQHPGKIPQTTIIARAYSSWPVIVKGRQEEGVISELNFSGKYTEGKIGFEVYKPNATTGIPFSRGSKFGLVSLTLNGRLYHRESKSSSNSWTVGNTRYTQTTTVTTTLEFPQLPDEYWDNMLQAVYTGVVDLFRERFNIAFTDVEKVTSTPQYSTLFTDEEINTYTKISRTYHNTRRSSPKRLSEFFGKLSSSQSSETPINMMMQAAGIDGLLSMDINLDIAADRNNHVVLIPSINFSIIGRDEARKNRNGTYAQGTIRFRHGVPFNGDAVRKDPNSLVSVCSVDQMIACLDYMLTNLRNKEVAMGYDKIWSIGE
jgi:hypothetical protein